MKVIKDEDLLSLHYQIEKSEIKQKKLEDLLKEESDKLKKVKKINRMLGGLFLIFLLLTVYFVADTFFFNGSYTEKESLLKKELALAKQQLETLKKEKTDLKEIKDLYFYRKLIDKDTVYSVQLKAFNSKEIPSVSKKYTNVLIYNDTSYYKMSLGIFETLNEAQDFRRLLINAGLDKKIFVISYKDGKRLKIEDYE